MSETQPLFRCLDLETTGIPSETERHAIVEAGWCDILLIDPKQVLFTIQEPQTMLCNPGRVIPPEAMAVHHLRDEDVATAPGPDVVCRELGAKGDYFVAHVADFEQQFFGGGERPWLDTWKGALRAWPSAPSHSLQVLRYHLKLDERPLFERDLAFPPHRAGPDAYVCAFLLVELLRLMSIEQLLKFSRGPALLAKVTFGKHFGKTWAWVGEHERGYIHWILEKSDITDRDIRATAKYYLGRSHESSS